MIRNVHERTVAAPAERVGRLLDRLGGPDDRVWPVPEWPPLVLDGPVAVGARGGHGTIGYRVVLHDPGRIVGFAFDPGTGLVGVHTLSVEALPDGPGGAARSRVRHVMEARPVGAMRLLWPLAGRRLHDALTESLLDRVEQIAARRPPTAEHWSPWLRALRLLDAERAVAVPVPATRLLTGALPRVDLARAHAVTARPGAPDDPQAWADAVFGRSPAWVVVARTDDEVLLGDDATPADVRASVLREPDRVVVSTVVRLRTGRGRAHVAHLHPVLARGRLTRAARRLSRNSTTGASPVDRMAP